jgi:hypothetical protein
MAVKYDLGVTIEYQTVCNIVLVPITLGTFANLAYFSVRTKSVRFYARLLFATWLLFMTYVLNLQFMRNYLPGYDQKWFRNFWRSFMYVFSEFVYFLRPTATYLYCWQLYDTVAAVCQTRPKGPAKWFTECRQLLSIGLLIAFYLTFFYDIFA